MPATAAAPEREAPMRHVLPAVALAILAAATIALHSPGDAGPAAAAQERSPGVSSSRPRCNPVSWRCKSAVQKHRACITKPRPGARWCPAEHRQRMKALARRRTAERWAVPDGPVKDHLLRILSCESGGRWHINTGNGFTGGLQFMDSTWQAMGGTGSAYQASPEEQLWRGYQLYLTSGPGQWPVCSRR